ncbi:hypothetical protein GCM10008018_70390 [Paenibacillus marchantiophytorum]|uniref:Xylose isomerase-like TIM barrel domain-containing protein n=1 Tax=Paenibacillus marchantiophytorum TaxID=1619310 RepID=A0ABQ1FK17_9BACL|nr:TIM barrel protein [Paenibacillus marchantiophytorum]GGA15561.1 hypothetical protein GCM10008018_70390 [Paenibacillus marchantiophytorum]
MNRFMIGQYGTLDYHKFHKDFKEGFYGIEACLFGDETDIAKLVKEAREHGFQIGVHFPLRAGLSKFRDALFLASDDAIRSRAYESVKQELVFLAAIKPSYVLFHYPKPVILDDRVDWNHWRFEQSSEFTHESSYGLDEFKEKSESWFEWISQKGREFTFTPVLELDALNTYIYADTFLEELLDKFSNVKLCVDTARCYLQDRIDPYFDARTIMKKFAKYTEIIHLSNVKMTANNTVEKSRIPVMPHQDPNEGWAPIEEYLHILTHENKQVKIMFEHRSDLVNEEELLACYSWVEAIIT